MKSMRFFALGVLLSSAYAVHAQTTQEPASNCTTDATNAQGERKSCVGEASVYRAPEGFVFAQTSLKGGLTKQNGSEKGCKVQWGDFVEIIPGSKIEQPRTLTVQAYARSPKGHASGRGWATCKYTVALSKYTTS